MRLTTKWCILLIHEIHFSQCVATDGKALTRVCVIDFDTGKVVYDQLVKPMPIISHGRSVFFGLIHNPSLSGITAAALDPITTTLADV